MTPLNTLRLFAPRWFINLFRLMINTFCIILRFLPDNLLILFKIVLSYCKALNNNCNNWLLLDVKPKNRFLDIKKIPKAPPPQKKK